MDPEFVETLLPVDYCYKPSFHFMFHVVSIVFPLLGLCLCSPRTLDPNS